MAAILETVTPLQKFSIDFARNVPVDQRQNVEIGEPAPQNCHGYCPECPLFDCGTAKLLKKYWRHRKEAKHAHGLNLTCGKCGTVFKQRSKYDAHLAICDQNIGDFFATLEKVNVNRIQK